MRLHQLAKITKKTKKRVGRGIGSGRGKTAGRGSKGQKARGKIPIGFTGSLPLYKKLPLKRGKGNPSVSPKATVVSLSQLATFPAKATINLESLLKADIIKKGDLPKGIKILGVGEVREGWVIKEVSVSAKVRSQIESKGGRIENG